MKIISKFHDYYDTALGHGFDPHVIYKRETKETLGLRVGKYSPTAAYYSTGYWNRHTDFVYSCSLFLFCGKPIPVITLETPNKNLDRDIYFCYNIEQVDEVVRPFKKIFVDYIKIPKKRELRSRYWHMPFRRDMFKQLFDDVPSLKEIENIHFKLRSPVLLVTQNNNRKKIIVSDPILKDYTFQRAVDPYTAFQEISMYMGGVLGQQEMVHRPVSDEIKRDMAGFDEMSFKTYTPGERKRRRRENKARKRA